METTNLDRMRPIAIRLPESGEVPLSPEERLVARRDGIEPVDVPKWHPALVSNFALMSARLHRKAVTA
jgi:hypothetical protein